MKTSLRRLYGRHRLPVTEYLCHKWPQVCSTCRKHFPALSSFMTYNRVCNQINTTSATSGAGTKTRPPFLVGSITFDLQLYVYVFQIVVCPGVLFLLAIVFSVLLRYMNSDYPFGLQTLLNITILTELSHFLHQ